MSYTEVRYCTVLCVAVANNTSNFFLLTWDFITSPYFKVVLLSSFLLFCICFHPYALCWWVLDLLKTCVIVLWMFLYAIHALPGAWGSVVVKALRYDPGIDSGWCHWAFLFRGSPRWNHVPWGRLNPWKWVPRISPGVKAAGAYGWRPTILVVPNVEMIRSLNLPGTPRATSACRGTPLLYFYNTWITEGHSHVWQIQWKYKASNVFIAPG